MKKKLGVTIAVLIALCLVTVTFVGAKSLYETKKVPKGERHSISEIIHPSAKWEKVVDGAAESRFMEGINFDRSGAMWMVSPMSNELLKVTSITGNLFAYYQKKGTTGCTVPLSERTARQNGLPQASSSLHQVGPTPTPRCGTSASAPSGTPST